MKLYFNTRIEKILLLIGVSIVVIDALGQIAKMLGFMIGKTILI